MTISLILPYWDRKEAADRAIARLDALYAGWLDLEVIVVDDGNRERYIPPPGRLNVRVLYLPEKDEPKSPVTCWNAGARAATGEILAISCIEVLHERPVLDQLAQAVIEGGPKAYVLASAWCPDLIEWHCHSTHRSASAGELPSGTGRAFLGVMHRELYFAAGGWDEDYRDGAGYEDIDFIRRMLRAGAEFQIRDELRVIHPKRGASIAWPPEKFLRNEALLRAKWTQPVTIVCLLRTGGAFGPEYVNILRDMVARNLPLGYPGRFVCLTDDPAGLDSRIETLALPGDLEKWWGKLYLFKRGLFRDGERMVFFDLDTVLVGRLDEIVGYRGQFATLHDFYKPERLGPAVMLWEAGGNAARIWDAWEAAGKPRDPWGDLWWINQLDDGQFAREADVLQKILPGQFCSFKADCRPWPPKGARVVCFHGTPRPHEAALEWVRMAWRVGGGVAPDIELVANTCRENVILNIRRACRLPIPRLGVEQENAQPVAIVGGGPSLTGTLDELRRRIADGCLVVAVNGVAHFLAQHGIKTDVQVLIDARPSTLRFVAPPVAARYLVASQCAWDVFDALDGRDVTLMHMNTAELQDALPAGEDRAPALSSGSTVGLAAMAAMFQRGHRMLYLFGFDSSYEDDHHAYAQSENDPDESIEAEAGGRKFRCAPWMVAQVNEFQELARQMAEAGAVISVAGDGLLPHVARLMSAPEASADPIADLPTNTPTAVLLEQTRQNLARDLPQFREQARHGKTAIIVGGGPSLADTLPTLQKVRARGAAVFALNGTHDWLIERGIVPDFHVLADGRPENVVFVQRPDRRVVYLVAAQSHPAVFDALAGFEVVVWVPYIDGIEPVMDACGKPVLAIGGGATVGLKTLTLASLWGFRHLHAFGFDSAYRGSANHAYPQPLNDAESVIEVECAGRQYRCAPWMVQQAQGFEQQLPVLRAHGCNVKVHGDGLIPWIAQQLKKEAA